MSEITLRRLGNNLLSRKWMISSSSRGVSLSTSSMIRYPDYNNNNKCLGAAAGYNCSRMMLSSTKDAAFVWPPKSAPWLSKTSPWLLLPPIFKRYNNNGFYMVYQFYTLGENKLLEKTYDEDEDEDGSEEEEKVDHLEAWDLRDPLSPRNIPMPLSVVDKSESSFSGKYKYKFLVVAEASDELFHVTRYVDFVGPHGRYVHDHYYGTKMGFEDIGIPYKTHGFDIHKYDPETGSLVRMDRSLGGLALFIGCNDGLALPAADFPDDELKPDSIYYTGPPEWGGHDDGIFNPRAMGGHDVGIYNYQDNTFSSCYYPPDMQSRKTIYAPMWLTPTPLKRFPLLVENHHGSLSCASSSSFF